MNYLTLFGISTNLLFIYDLLTHLISLTITIIILKENITI